MIAPRLAFSAHFQHLLLQLLRRTGYLLPAQISSLNRIAPGDDRAGTTEGLRRPGGQLSGKMAAQPLSHAGGRAADQGAHIGHAFAALVAEKSAVALNILDQQAFDQAVKIRRLDINTAPRTEVIRAEKRPDLLAFRAIGRAHTQRIGAIIEKTRIAKISDQGFR